MTTETEIRGAIGVHHTEVSGGAWDGPANEARIPNDAGASALRKAHAWVDSEGDRETKDAYKFVHHEVDGDGNVGPANMRACSATIAALNGGRGGADIPASDRMGVHGHVAAHMMDGDMEPPELKSLIGGGLERRAFPFSELRVEQAADGKPSRILGHAAVFNQLSEPIGWQGFRERIRPGAFRKTIREGDVRSLWNHNPDYVLGRTKSNTLTLREDKAGLQYDVTPPDTQWARDLMVSMERGDVDQSSFGFQSVRDDWSTENGEMVRELVEVKLFDVSPVTFPAYPQTDSQVRAVFASAGIDWEALAAVITRSEHGLGLTATDQDMMRSSIDVLTHYLPAAPAQEGHPAGDGGDDQAQVRLTLLRRRLEVAEKTLI